METLLLVILGAGLFILWRRTEALEARLREFERILAGLRLQLSGDRVEDPQAATPANTQQPPVVAAHQQRAEAALPATRSVSDVGEAESDAGEAVPQTAPKPQEDLAQGIAAINPDSAFSMPKLPKIRIDFEDIFGRLLPIWAGGIALAVAGFFLVRYSIEQGLLGPQVRVALSFVFGVLLLGGAELAFRQEHRISDPRVRQALAGAGLATLYASFYLAGSHYGLIGSAVAFLGLAGVTGAAILLSFRFGLPCAVLGLVGGFAAPMLVDSQEPNVPMLALYLALVTGGLTYAGNRQGRSWLALAALAGGLGWGVLMLFTGLTGISDLLAIGGYIVVIGAVLPAFTEGRGASPVIRIGAAALAALQLAFMVQQAGFSLLAWGLYGLLAAALSFFAWTEPKLREATAFAAGLAVVLLGFWPDVPAGTFTVVGLGLAAIFAGVPLANIWRDAHRKFDGFQVAGFALGLTTVTYLHFAWLGSDMILAAVCFGIALLPALAAWMLWPADAGKLPIASIANVAAAAIGTVSAGLIATPIWAAPIVISAVTIAVIILAWKRVADYGLHWVIWAGAASAVIALLGTLTAWAEAELLFGSGDQEQLVQACIRWGAVGAMFVALTVRGGNRLWMTIAEIFAALVLYGMAAQFIPGMWLAWVVALAAVVLAYKETNRTAARMTLMALALSWAAEPILIWSVAALESLFGEAMLVANDIGWRMIALQFAPLLVAVGTLLWRAPERLRSTRTALIIGSGAVAAVGVHLMYKQLFALENGAAFISLGLAERTVWQASLVGGAALIGQYLSDRSWAKPVSIAMCGTCLLHFLYFTWGLHNPLWAPQEVGALPIANMLLPAYGLALAAAWLLRRTVPMNGFTRLWMFDAVLMLLIAFLALSELRHAFTGSLMSVDPMGQTEDLLRSLLGIILAIGFLLWGARSQTRSWRIGSLVLLLIAVLKVFVFDTAGLEGLARIASFMALGFSLIGIGWFYTRQLAGPKAADPPDNSSVPAGN
ncbi:DUF2339 domain-containing protein [Altererythrobacter sp. RZ02]|uniref:DUF2339 domain-containing protein n=1 Tax=Pontixanthobacter rizhaonensis TaxID=2730337 RepID=A0A848QHK0_9SPHN|nr:DUF2339 domain-containing protein [Pontixanthobacter rizhaonensis]NMW32122.1 DUF2339 domain-containing protein [Pontixanthobacter rizhaonensis]